MKHPLRPMRERPGLRAAAALALAGLIALVVGCGGGGSAAGPAATPVTPPTVSAVAALQSATALTITITGVSVGGPPIVSFVVTNQAGAGMTGLQAADLAFNIAKLVPAAGGGPAEWQDYINVASASGVQGSQESTTSGAGFGTLVGQGGGNYVYTFATDITSATANPCPGPCTDSNGNALNLTYAPGLTTRVTIQQSNTSYPSASGIYDFVPAGGGLVTQREVVSTATCNTCHEPLSAHGNAVDVRLCVTCHNPGSWTGGSTVTPLAMEAIVHRIHYNDASSALPSVLAGTQNLIGGVNFSAVTFPQDVRNCGRCHSATPANSYTTSTAQGNLWQSAPSRISCGSCHDNVYFGATPDPTKPYQTKAHDGGVQTNDSACANCHAAGVFPGPQDIVVAHSGPSQMVAAAAHFSFNILGVTQATPGSKPVITFSVTDPTNNNAPYNLQTAPAFTAGSASTLSLQLAWTTVDFSNVGSGQAWGQPISINALTSAVPGAVAGTYTVTSPVALPTGLTGSMRVTMDGHPAGDVTTPGTYTDELQVKSSFLDVAVTGTVLARRTVVDISKCDACHAVLSVHGSNRTDEPGVCVACHNPNATDGSMRPAGLGIDGLAEQAIDFKVMIHGIHAGQASQGGFRINPLVVYGYGGSVNNFGSVVFPGRLSDCNACHAGTSYALTGLWAAPTAGGVLGTTTSSAASGTNPVANLRTSPTAAVCTSCHDGAAVKAHVTNAAEGGSIGATEAAISTGSGEQCVTCHGTGAPYDVQVVHNVPASTE